MDSTEKKQVGTITGARALVDALLREGVDHVFGIPGTQNLAIIDALRDTPQIRFILTRHEQGAAFMAYGFARAGSRPAVVTATEGPGVTNLATGIGAACRGFVPVISVCGVQESSMRERDATQDMDQVTFMRPITKWAYSIPNVQKVQESVRKAFRVALTEPQGPTHIEAASEVLLEQCAIEAIAPAAYRNTVLPSCSSAQLDQVYALLAHAEKPVFVVGRGVISEHATDAMAELAERTGIPVAALQYSPDAFPSSHPAGARAARAQRVRQRQSHRAQSRRHHRDRRAYRCLFDHAQVRHLQRAGETRASQRRTRPDRHRVSGGGRRDGFDAELHRGTQPNARPKPACANRGSTWPRRAPNGRPNCRARSSTTQSRSSRSSSRT